MPKLEERNQGEDELIGDGSANRITEVTVYPDQAYVTRRIKTKAKPKLNRFLIEVLAFVVDPDSIQANLYGRGELLSVLYKKIPIKDMPQEDVRRLADKKEELARRWTVLKSAKERFNKQVGFLDSMTDFAKIELPKKIKTRFPKTEELKTMLEFLQNNYDNLDQKIIDLDNQIEDLDKEIAVVDRKLKSLSKPKNATRKVIEILFNSDREQDLQIEVFYLVKYANWQPIYKVDVALDLSSVKMIMFSQIRQKTGENWSDIKLIISNAIPIKSSVLPDLKSWYLSLIQRRAPLPTKSQPPKALGELRAAEEELLDADCLVGALAGSEKEDLELEMADFSQSDQRELPTAFEYELQQPIDIDSGDGETILPLYTKEMTGDFFIHAVPSCDTLAYLVCRITPDAALLAGKLSVYFGGRFVSSSLFSEKKPGEDLLLNLGADRGVKISREKLSDKQVETFFGVVDRASIVREIVYRIIIENLENRDRRVHLLDGIPVSKTDRIVIKGLELKPESTTKNYREREGVMFWDFQMKPKSVREILLKFSVKYPKNEQMHGL